MFLLLAMKHDQREFAVWMYKYNCSEEAKLLPLIARTLLTDRLGSSIPSPVNYSTTTCYASISRMMCAESKIRNQLESDRSASDPREFAVRARIHLQNAYIRTVLNYVNYFTWYVYSTAFCEAYIYDGPQNQIHDFRETYKRSSVLNKTKKKCWEVVSSFMKLVQTIDLGL